MGDNHLENRQIDNVHALNCLALPSRAFASWHTRWRCPSPRLTRAFRETAVDGGWRPECRRGVLRAVLGSASAQRLVGEENPRLLHVHLRGGTAEQATSH